MPQAARHRDLDSGHGCFPPRPIVSGSSDVFTNSRNQHRIGDMLDVHYCGLSGHPGTTLTGSSTVFCNSIPVSRVGDEVSCGSVIMTGSTDVFVGG